ncbi:MULTISPECIES: tyrosine-type recombinase/integrase [unclassified Frankia]|uniref:tyrosine-type recombinase/integrase n=1 Tax=unclassified Frankia TaxID=2632575 RepID=UPI000690C38E|nr:MULTISPECIES: tyrosine-type recombinase/integrase [unclassified Frankia]OHV52829.1 hypothetical protein CgIS1_16300 [Frankia sp. CgIS1]
MLVNITVEEVMDNLAAAGCGYAPVILDQLWATVPDDLRLGRLSAATVPERYRNAFTAAAPSNAILVERLPEPMGRELTWCCLRVIELGGKIALPGVAMLTRRLAEAVADLGARGPVSLMDLPARDWCQQFSLAVHRRKGRLPTARSTQTVRETLVRFLRLLALAYDTRPWWQRESWNPVEDPRIPLRAHEPQGREAIYFQRVSASRLRLGLQWYCKISLETGALRWSTVGQRVFAMTMFDAFLASRGGRPTHLADTPEGVRALMLDYLGHVRASRASRGPTEGQPLSANHMKILLISVEQFYAFMHDHKHEAAAALGDPGWLRLGPQHAAFYRRGEIPRPVAHRDTEQNVIPEAAFTQIMASIGMLGDPVADGGFGDEQAMRIMMLQTRLGRRISELLLLDHDPLCALAMQAPSDEEPDAFAARLRYQQTKIDGAPDTVLVDREIVTIIRAQQEWASGWIARHGAPGATPRYLFLGEKMNRHGNRPYVSSTLHRMLTEMARRLDIRDDVGRLVDFQRTHRFRHTKATSLLNAGVPIHVVQRYLGHLSPTMTMHYAKTLTETHEAEFLRYRKRTADARELAMPAADLYDLLHLDSRTDRILPNGYCLLPPRQSCDRGNACLTCDKFTTDATFLPELRAQHRRTLTLIDTRQAAFTARTGTPMGTDNVWLAGRHREAAALEAVIAALDADTAAQGQPVRGAGVVARTDATARRATGDLGRGQPDGR